MSFIKFLGTAGARFVVMKQLRASGGVWLSLGKTNLYIDPGPGALGSVSEQQTQDRPVDIGWYYPHPQTPRPFRRRQRDD